jgi:hypothetical protein
MPSRRKKPVGLDGLRHALDQLTYGAEDTLNLRAHLPTRAQAVQRTEAWLRERQAAGATEVLVVTGRGQGSVDGVSVVRQGVIELLASLARRHVVAGYREHTAGSLVVELLPFAETVRQPKPTAPAGPPPPDPRALAALAPATRVELRKLAVTQLQLLGVHSPTRRIVETEMLAQFGRLAASLPGELAGAAREAALQEAARDAVHDLVRD